MRNKWAFAGVLLAALLCACGSSKDPHRGCRDCPQWSQVQQQDEAKS